jgi:undecaprenyl-diphosphatase
VLATAAFGWLARGVFADRFVPLDERMITGIYRYWSAGADLLMLFFTTIGDTPVLALLLTAVAAALLSKGRWIDAAGLILAGGGAGILNQVLKAIFQRARPDLIPSPFELSSYSFPSGHAMGSIACYGMLAFVVMRLARGWPARLAIGVVAWLIILGVGLSRVYFGVHYPTDVLGGFLAGGTWLAISIATVEAAEWHARRRTRQETGDRRLGEEETGN